ncbi:capsid protein [Stenotrophomonas rhizophila]|nr:capsid protein [Stenotrophomonas rhizophila]MCC7635360.1 capsid protein [Stenotrophomonas rhizophila]MCC7664411.1 capsid protein [Stenotrophomonas rhizophila]
MEAILTGLSTADGVTAMIGAAALIALLGFTKWAAKKVASFFG